MAVPLSREAIKAWIKSNPAAEFERESIDYYLHITEAGEIVTDRSQADASFICRVPLEEHGITPEDYQQAENPECIYAHEADGDLIFERIVEDLVQQAAEYMRQRTT